MPYIKHEERESYDMAITAIAEALPQSGSRPGHLNYIITKLLKEAYLEKGDTKYAHHNELMGVLECVRQEWYRMFTAPYENTKIQENGEV